MTLTLHNFFRSSSSTRVRVALNLKGVDYDYVGYVLRQGETRTPEFLTRSPAGLVPVLELDDGSNLSQSMAIIEWLNETYPDPPLLPAEPRARAEVRSLANMIACEIHPLNNLRVLNYLADRIGLNEDAVGEWFRHWVAVTFEPLESRVSQLPGRYCSGDDITIADICLYAQVWNNRRFDVDMTPFPALSRVFETLDKIPAFADAAPSRQPDAGP